MPGGWWLAAAAHAAAAAVAFKCRCLLPLPSLLLEEIEFKPDDVRMMNDQLECERDNRRRVVRKYMI
jgi:hypothetical protein